MMFSISPSNQRIHSTPFFQRYYAIPKANIESELENAISQTVANDDITRTPSSNAVYEHVALIRNTLKIQRFTFDTPLTEWHVIHNNNTNVFQETIFDINHQRMFAQIVVNDLNSFTVLLTEPMSGYVDVRF